MGKPWTQEERDILAAHPNHTSGQLAIILGRSMQAVRDQRRYLSINYKRPERWQQYEIDLLIAQRYRYANEIAAELGRTPASVSKKAYELGIKLGKPLDEQPVTCAGCGLPKLRFNACDTCRVLQTYQENM